MKKYSQYNRTLKTLKKEVLKDIKTKIKSIKFETFLELDEPITILSHEYYKISYTIIKLTKWFAYTQFDIDDNECERLIKFNELDIDTLIEILKTLEKGKFAYDPYTRS